MRPAGIAAALSLAACAVSPGHPEPESETAQIGYRAADLIPSCIAFIENPEGMEVEAQRLGARPGKPAATGQRGWILPGPGRVSIIEQGPGRCLISIMDARPAGIRLAVAERVEAMEGAMRANADGLGTPRRPRVSLWGLCAGGRLYSVDLRTPQQQGEPPNALLWVTAPREGGDPDGTIPGGSIAAEHPICA